MKKKKYIVSVWLIIFLTALLTACSIGPNRLEQGHLAYNKALKAAADDELLLNLVRLRYLDTIEFLTASSVSSQISFSVSVGARVGTELDEPTRILAPEISYSDRPTVTFIPQRGKEFATSLLNPVDPVILNYLFASDWDVSLLLRLFVRQMNGLVNEIGAIDPKFIRTAQRLSELQLGGQVMFGFNEKIDELSDPIEAQQISGADLVEAAKAGFRFKRLSGDDAFVLTKVKPQPVLYINTYSKEVASALGALGLKQNGRSYYELERATFAQATKRAGEVIAMRNRSILLALLYLVQGVQVPEVDLKQGLTLRDWPAPAGMNEKIDEMFKVRSSREKPNAMLAVQYRDNWFYIDDSDAASRVTFLHLAEIIRLQFAEPAQAGPVLTLPVGGP